VTFHDEPESGLSDDARRSMHFGQVVSPDEWLRLRDRIIAASHSPIRSVAAADAPNRRAKLLVADPSSNLVEINSTAIDG
jgi:extradiol dioxygenase family protein